MTLDPDPVNPWILIRIRNTGQKFMFFLWPVQARSPPERTFRCTSRRPRIPPATSPPSQPPTSTSCTTTTSTTTLSTTATTSPPPPQTWPARQDNQNRRHLWIISFLDSAYTSGVDPNTLNWIQNFWPNLNPDPGLCYQFWEKKENNLWEEQFFFIIFKK